MLISSIKYIDVNGDYALDNTTINSNLNDETLILKLNINNVNEFSQIILNCNNNDTCEIDCQLSNSCIILTVNCNSGQCFVNCNPESGIQCPNGDYIIDTPTTSPTQQPTNPSLAPSVDPTMSPVNMQMTTEASSAPTFNPAVIVYVIITLCIYRNF